MRYFQRIRFPAKPATQALYRSALDGGDFSISDTADGVAFAAGQIITFDSYFNSFFENYAVRFTAITSIELELEIEGTFLVTVHREGGHADREILISRTFSSGGDSRTVKLPPIALVGDAFAGRLAFTLRACSEGAILRGGGWLVSPAPLRPVHLAIVICTFRREVSLRSALAALLADAETRANLEVYVVDNASELKDNFYQDEKVHLIRQDNSGGAGGFTRGIIEAMERQVEFGHTHILLMDDDIELDPEAVYRAVSWMGYASHDFALAGGMLDLYRQRFLHEAGAISNRSFEETLGVTPVNHNIDLGIPKNLSKFKPGSRVDYGAWWFFGFSIETARKVGLPLPCFIRGDDREYSIRLGKKNIPIVPVPGIAVWHEPFYAKKSYRTIYFDYKNSLICHAVYDHHLSARQLRKEIVKRVNDYLLIHDYRNVAMILDAITDFCRGPAHMMNTPPADLQRQVQEGIAKHTPQRVPLPEWIKDAPLPAVGESYVIHRIRADTDAEETNTFLFERRLCVRTARRSRQWRKLLLRHVKPLFRVRQLEPQILIHHDDYHWTVVNATTSFAVYNQWFNEVELIHKDLKQFFDLLIRMHSELRAFERKYADLKREWQSKCPEMTSVSFWKKYLEMDNPRVLHKQYGESYTA